MPMRLKDNVRPAASNKYAPRLFNWDKHGSAYEYFLTRGAPMEFAVHLAERVELRVQLGAWQLYTRKHVPNTATK